MGWPPFCLSLMEVELLYLRIYSGALVGKFGLHNGHLRIQLSASHNRGDVDRRDLVNIEIVLLLYMEKQTARLTHECMYAVCASSSDVRALASYRA